jgi:hypothetical protein
MGLADPDAWGLDREVGASPAELLRCLRQAAPVPLESLAPDRYRLVLGDVELTLTVRPLPERRIGQLALPVVGVSYRFRGDRRAGEDLLAALDAGMQRGGG